MKIRKKKSDSDVSYQMYESKLPAMKAFLELQGDRIKLLECLDTYACSLPDWLLKITEGLQSIIDYKQSENLPCEEEKEILSNVGYFFTKIAYSSNLISDWHRDIAFGKEETEKLLNSFCSGEKL